jgi:hypothetical protein
MSFSDLVFILMMGLASLWLVGFVITLFVTAIDSNLAAIDYTEEIQRKYL